MSKKIWGALCGVLLLAAGAWAQGQACVDCHKKTSPNIVTDWQLSKHSQNDVGCAVCHGERAHDGRRRGQG